MKNATRIMTLTGAAALAAFATSASAHNPMTCGEFANLKGETQRAGDPKGSIEDNMFHKDLSDNQKIDIVLDTCSEGKFELVTDAVTEAMKHH